MFRDRIVELCGGHDTVLRAIATALGSTHELQSFLPNAPDHVLRAHVLTVLDDVLRLALREPLLRLAAKHLDDVRAEYELFAGERPDEQHAAQRWETAYVKVLCESLVGDVATVLGPNRVASMIAGGHSIADLVDAILASPTNSREGMAKHLGFTDEDVAALVAAARSAARPKAPVSDNRPKLREARRRRAAGSDGHDGVSRAAAAVLEAVLKHTAVGEVRLAAAIGVSRAQMNNYRSGRTPWRPDETQFEAISQICDSTRAELWQAVEAYRLTLRENENE